MNTFLVLLCIISAFASNSAQPVKYLPNYGATQGVQYAGFLTVNETTGSNIFYYFVESTGVDPKTAPVTLWLNGGPGCSSLLGLFVENGPYRISETGQITDNPHSWTAYSNMIFIDQPVGSGYSYTMSNESFPTNEEEVSRDLYNALQLFFKQYPQYANLDFYITGESYAGKYVPSLASYIHSENRRLSVSRFKEAPANQHIPLKGLAIGNGWVHPIVQNQAYVDYPYNLGLINSRQRKEAEAIQDKLVDAINKGNWDKANDLSNDLEAYVLNAAGEIDIDNVLFPSDPIGPLIDALTTYLNTPATRTALNVGDRSWIFANTTTGDALNADEQKSVLHLLPELLDSYRVLVYTGNMDINCNLVGVESYLDALPWDHSEEFYNAPRKSWMVDGELAGYARPFGNLQQGGSVTNLIVRNAGHEVPFFQPKNALDMFKRFITGSPWF